MSMLDAALGGVLRFWLTSQAKSATTKSQPTGTPQVHAPGPDADRILLVIDRPSVGDGLLSQDLGLAGHLARQLSSLSGRGTDIDILANGNMTARECATAVAAVDLARFDSIVLMVGSSEALALVPPRQWSAHLGELLDEIEAWAPHRVHVSVVQIPPVRALIDFPRLFAALVGARIAQLNAATVAACAHRDGVSVLPFPLAAAADGRNSSHVFSVWARFIAPTIRTHLDYASGTSRQAERANEPARQRSLDELKVVDTSDLRVDEIVLTAHDLFGIAAAAVAFLDHERRWVMSAVGTSMKDSPRIGSLCDLAIQQAGVFVIEDIARSDYRPADSHGHQVPGFYAGFPVEAPNGRRIGVLCIMDAQPRRFSASDASLLRELALQVQTELWAHN